MKERTSEIGRASLDYFVLLKACGQGLWTLVFCHSTIDDPQLHRYASTNYAC